MDTATDSMDPTASKIAELKREGYTADLNKYVRGHGKAQQLLPEDFQIDRYYRIDLYSDPNEQVIVYAISSKNEPELKGVFINGYGTNSDPFNNWAIEKIALLPN